MLNDRFLVGTMDGYVYKGYWFIKKNFVFPEHKK